MSVVIVGGGIAGVGAAIELKRQNRPFVLLEASDQLGGHQLTLEPYPGCAVDVGFIFGNKGYRGLLELVSELGLETTKHTIQYTSATSDGNLLYSNAVTMAFAAEVARFYDIIARMRPGWWLITLRQFLDRNGFQSDFCTYVIEPALSILFVSASGSWDKPAYVILSMFTLWTRLDVRSGSIQLWKVKGGNQQIVQRAATYYDLSPHVHLNTRVQSVSRNANETWTVCSASSTHTAKAVIMAVGDVNDVLRIYKHPYALGKTVLEWYAKQTQPCHSILHTWPGLYQSTQANEPYHYIKRDSGWVLTGQLQYMAGADCKQHLYLSVYPDRTNHTQDIPEEHVLKRMHWVHPDQGRMYLLSVGWLRIPQWIECEGIHFCGAWSTVLGHEYSFQSGLEAARRVFKRPLFQDAGVICLVVLGAIVWVVFLLAHRMLRSRRKP